MEWLKENSREFTDPVLIPSRGQRRTGQRKRLQRVFWRYRSEDKTLKIYAKLFHEIYNEVEKEEVIDDTLLWIEKHL